jgi:hypothetical protein
MTKPCECGCGQPAPIAKRTNAAKGYVKGEPSRFVLGHHSSKTREKIAASKRGRPRDQATRAKISAALTGRVDRPEVRAKKRQVAERGSESPVWVGQEASYNAIHNRARLTLPQECEHADSTCRGILEVALRQGLPGGLLRTSRRGHVYYVGENIQTGYMRLCRSHHRRYDA